MKRIISIVLLTVLLLSCFAISAVADSTFFCRMCGNRIPSDSRFCSFCGASVSSSSQNNVQSSSYSAPYPSQGYAVNSFVAAYEDMVKSTKYHRIAMKDAEASSELWSRTLFPAKNAIDDDPTTSWQEGSSGHSPGESITVYLKEKSDISMIRFRMGNAYNDVSFKENDRPKNITVYFSDGSSASGEFPDKNGKFVLAFTYPITAEWFTVVIDDIYEGTATKDCCISEITPYALG